MSDDVKIRWPRKVSVLALTGLVVGIFCGLLLMRIGVTRRPTLERFYFGEYLKSETVGDWYMPSLSGKPVDHRRPFPVVYVGRVPATPRLFDLAAGLEPSVVRTGMYSADPKLFHKWIRDTFFGGRDLTAWIWSSLRWYVIWSVVLIIGFVGAGRYFDRQRNIESRNGRRLEGSGYVSRCKFNHCKELAR